MNKIGKNAIAMGVVIALSGCNQTSNEITTNSNVSKPLHVVSVKESKFDANKSFYGTVQASEKAGLAFRVPGTLSEVLVTKGQSVSKGDVLARIDQHDYTVSLEELEARKLEAISAHKLAKAELNRVRQAMKDNAIASVNEDRAISGYERSVSAIKVIDKNIQRAKDTLSYTEILAPFDGIISQVNFDAFEQVLPGVPVLSMQNNSALEVEIDVPDTLLHRFELGQSGEVSWYQHSKSLPATLTEISTQPDPIRQTYTLTFAVDKHSSELLPGRAVTLNTEVNEFNKVYCLPYSSLLGKNDDMFVHVVRDELIVPKRVEVQTFNGSNACLSADFNSDDLIVVSGTHYLNDGDTAISVIHKEI